MGLCARILTLMMQEKEFSAAWAGWRWRAGFGQGFRRDALISIRVGIQCWTWTNKSFSVSFGVSRTEDAIRGLDVGVLINNVGVLCPYARFLHEVDEKLLSDLMKVNVEGTTKVTRAVLPGMVERRKGAIVNVGSGAAIVIPSDPHYSVYAATKAYIDQFSRCLYVEWD